MRKNSLRYKALKRCAQVNENVAVDLLKLKRAGVDVKNFVNQVENIDAPYSILENYNFMSIDDVDVHDIKESLMELGATRKLLSESVYEHNNIDGPDRRNYEKYHTWELEMNDLRDQFIEDMTEIIPVLRRYWKQTNEFNLQFFTFVLQEGYKFYNGGINSDTDWRLLKNLFWRTLQDDRILMKSIMDTSHEYIRTQNEDEEFDDYATDILTPEATIYYKIVNLFTNWMLLYIKDKIEDVNQSNWQMLEKMVTSGSWNKVKGTQIIDELKIGLDSITESVSYTGGPRNRKSLRESKKELDPKADLKKRQAELDKIVEEIKNDANLDKKSAKKYTTRLKKIKDLKELKKAKSIVKKLSKLYPEAADLLNEATVLKFVNAVRGKKAVLNENLKINNFHISTYSLKELKECYSKVAKNINVLKRKLRKSALNESYTAADIRKIKEELKKQTKLYGMLDEEISWKMLILQKGGLDKVRFINEGDDSKDEKEENAEDAASTSLDDLFNNIGDEMEDDIEKEEESDEKKEDKNDSDEDVELDSITITMKSEDAANALKDALIEKGIPEDAIDVEEAEEDEDESKNESVKYSNKFMRLFEDEELTEEDEADNNEEESNDDNSEEASEDDSNDDNSEDKAYNVTLTDTDYVNSLKDVMVDEYGYTEDEFWDSIGGKPVDDEEDSDNKDDEESDKDDSDNKDNEEDDDTSELDSIGADIFGEQ